LKNSVNIGNGAGTGAKTWCWEQEFLSGIVLAKAETGIWNKNLKKRNSKRNVKEKLDNEQYMRQPCFSAYVCKYINLHFHF
jgi:hypothetical protein